jgi:hypothetical protein
MHPEVSSVHEEEQVSTPFGREFMVADAHVSPLRFEPSHISGGSMVPLPQAGVAGVHVTLTDAASAQPRVSVTVAVICTVPGDAHMK